MVAFGATEEEYATINKIADRAVEKGLVIRDKISLEMDMEATHSNGNPLDFEKLLNANDFNFAHDVAGIQRHIDRKTGKLLDCFAPRCSLC